MPKLHFLHFFPSRKLDSNVEISNNSITLYAMKTRNKNKKFQGTIVGKGKYMKGMNHYNPINIAFRTHTPQIFCVDDTYLFIWLTMTIFKKKSVP